MLHRLSQMMQLHVFNSGSVSHYMIRQSNMYVATIDVVKVYGSYVQT